MTVPILIDVNLSPMWVPYLLATGFDAVHWSTVGDTRASDREIMDWAVTQDRMGLTHDLDFGTMLAMTHDSGPSVLQIRGEDVLPDHLGPLVLATLTKYQSEFASGALVVVSEARLRVRILPI